MTRQSGIQHFAFYRFINSEERTVSAWLSRTVACVFSTNGFGKSGSFDRIKYVPIQSWARVLTMTLGGLVSDTFLS